MNPEFQPKTEAQNQGPRHRLSPTIARPNPLRDQGIWPKAEPTISDPKGQLTRQPAAYSASTSSNPACYSAPCRLLIIQQSITTHDLDCCKHPKHELPATEPANPSSSATVCMRLPCAPSVPSQPNCTSWQLTRPYSPFNLHE